MNYNEAKEFLAKCSQEHLLAFWGELDKAGREALLAQISRIDKDDLAYCQKALAKGQAAPDTKGGKAPKVAVLKGAKQKDGTYDFYEVFAPAQSLLSEADLLVGNFETPMAGPDAKYTQHYYSFNAPDSYADALKKAGFHLVSTVNNHVFDRGFAGLERTLDILDDRGIGHTGTWRERDARSEAWYGKVGDTTVAIIAYTVSTNFGGSGGRCQAVGEKSHMVNMLQSHTGRVFADGVNREKTRIET